MDFRPRVICNPPTWASNRIEAWDEVTFRKQRTFTRIHSWIGGGSINVFTVLGTQHPDYGRLSWIELLQKGKRMDHNLLWLARNPHYYYDTAPKASPPMRYISADGLNWFVGDDGNHRTCIARFLLAESGDAMLHGVQMDEYRFDTDFETHLALLEDILEQRNCRWNIRHENVISQREDASGWKLDRYVNRVVVSNSQTVDGTHVGTPSLVNLIAVAKQPRWRRWFRSPATSI